MARRSFSFPVLAQRDIDWLVRVPKTVNEDRWRQKLALPPEGHAFLSARLDLDDVPPGPLRGHLHIYGRGALAQAPGDWSVGLVYTPYGAGRVSYPLIRCNGPHLNEHTNTIEKTVIAETPHVHLLTERYQQIGKLNSGYAEPTDRYNTYDGALSTLRDMGNLVSDAKLFLP